MGRRTASAATPAPATRQRDDYFYDPANPEAQYLWRWVSFQAPDLALELRGGAGVAWEASEPCSQQWPQLCSALDASALTPDSSLLGALATGEPNGLPPIPGLRLTCAADALEGELGKLWTLLARSQADNHSDVCRALQARTSRTPLDVARVLAAVYGHQLEPVIYTQGVAVSGRWRLAELDAETVDPAADIEAMVEPYLSGSKAWFTAGGDGGANLAGLVWADELAATTGDSRYADLLVNTGGSLPRHPRERCARAFESQLSGGGYCSSARRCWGAPSS